MKPVKPTLAPIREWARPRSLSWRQARSVFLVTNVVGFAVVGFSILINVGPGRPTAPYALIFPLLYQLGFFGYHLDWRSRGRLLAAVEAGVALPFLWAAASPLIFRATAWIFHIMLVFVPIAWAALDPGRKSKALEASRPSDEIGMLNR